MKVINNQNKMCDVTILFFYTRLKNDFIIILKHSFKFYKSNQSANAIHK